METGTRGMETGTRGMETGTRGMEASQRRRKVCKSTKQYKIKYKTEQDKIIMFLQFSLYFFPFISYYYSLSSLLTGMRIFTVELLIIARNKLLHR